MSLSSRKNLVAGFLGIMLMWPIVQMALAKHYDLNPWKFFAWGMYSRTPFTLDLRLSPMTRAGTSPAPMPDWSEATREAGSTFIERRKWWGGLLSPDAVAEVTLRDHPELQGVLVQVTRLAVNPETSRLEMTPSHYLYPRSARRE